VIMQRLLPFWIDYCTGGHLLKFEGKSFRLKEASKRLALKRNWINLQTVLLSEGGGVLTRPQVGDFQVAIGAVDPEGGMFNDWLRFDAVMLINTCCAFKGIISISFPIFIEKSDR